MGLGTNLFSSKQTLTERFGIEVEKSEITRKSELLESLADLDENNQELLIRIGKAPEAKVTAEEYNSETGSISVKAAEFENISNGVSEVILTVWTEGDQSDLQYIEMEMQEDGSYYAGVNILDFGYKLGEYFIDAYVTDGAGEKYMVGQTIGIVN